MNLSGLHFRPFLPLARAIFLWGMARKSAKQYPFPVALFERSANDRKRNDFAIESSHSRDDFKSVPEIPSDFLPAINLRVHHVVTVCKSDFLGKFGAFLKSRIFGESSPIFLPLAPASKAAPAEKFSLVFIMKPLFLALLAYLHRHRGYRFSAVALHMIFLQQGYRFHRLELGEILDELCKSGQLLCEQSPSGGTIYGLDETLLISPANRPKSDSKFQSGYLGGLYE